MKKALLYILMAVLPLLGMAQDMSEKDMMAYIARSASEVSTLQCDILQAKHMRMMKRDMVSQGTMEYSRPDCLRWQYTSPYSYTFLLNGGKVTLCKGEKKDVVDVAQNRMMREITQVMIGTMTGSALMDEKAFDAKVRDEGDCWKVTLLPKKKDIRQMYTTIVLTYNPKTAQTERVEMTEKTGDRTVIELKNIVRDKPIDAKVFNAD